MFIQSNDQIEVVDLEGKHCRIVHVNFYKRNIERLIPSDEFWVVDPIDRSLKPNLKRIEEAKNYKKPEEKKAAKPATDDLIDAIEDELEDVEELVKKIKKTRSPRKKSKK